MSLEVPIFSQRDNRWASQRLGTCDGITLGGYGCTITAITMVDGTFDPLNVWTPAQTDDWFTQGGGYAEGCLVDWSQINRLLPNTNHVGWVRCPDSPAPIQDIQGHLNAGGLVIAEVRFGGDPNAMHFVTIRDYNGSDLIFNDPWYGDVASFASGRFGTGDSSRDIWGVHYFVDTTPAAPPAPPAADPTPPPSVRPSEPPTPAPDPKPQDTPPAGTATPPATTPPPSAKPVDVQAAIDSLNNRVSALEKAVKAIRAALTYIRKLLTNLRKGKK